MCKHQVAAVMMLEGVFLKKYHLMMVPATKSIAAQNRTARGFYHSSIISLLKGTICGIKQKLLSLKVWLEEVSIHYTGFGIG